MVAPSTDSECILITSSGGKDCMSLCLATLDDLSEKNDWSFFALRMRSLGWGMGTAARTLTALTRSWRSGGVIAPGVGITSSGSDWSTCMLILNSLLETGRHFNASVIYTSHLPCAGNDTKRILNEAHSITIFPNGLGGRSLKYLLDSYLGLDKEQIKRVKKTDSRWVTIMKSYPMVVLTEKEAYTLSSKT